MTHPRRAQERHTHADLGSGAGFEPSKDVFRYWGPSATSGHSTYLLASTSLGSWSSATLLVSGGASLGNCYSHASTGAGYQESTAFLYAGREFEVQARFGVKSTPVATSYLFVGTTGGARPTSWSTAEYALGVSVQGTGGYWLWSQAVASGSGATTASAVPVVSGNLVQLTLVGSGAGAVTGTLTDLNTGTTEDYTYPSAASLTAWHKLLIYGVSSGGSLTKVIDRFNVRERLQS